MDNNFYDEQIKESEEIEALDIQKVEVINPQRTIQKVEIVNKDIQKDVQKVEVLNQPEIRMEKTDLTTLESRIDKLSRIMDKVVKVVSKLDIKPEVTVEKNEVNFPDIQKVDAGLPIGTQAEPDKNKANPSKYITVRLTNGSQYVEPVSALSNSGGASSGGASIKEEYTYTTISGQSVPTKIISYFQNYKVIEDISYDGAGNPIQKIRNTQPL